jgi:hypothetical protein
VRPYSAVILDLLIEKNWRLHSGELAALHLAMGEKFQLGLVEAMLTHPRFVLEFSGRQNFDAMSFWRGPEEIFYAGRIYKCFLGLR